MAPGKPVDGEIAAGVNDRDYFRVTTPQAPRDLTLIEVVNRSSMLAPVLKNFDASPQKAFDGYEPNDEIYNARPINLGMPVEASIMDPADTDFFSFVSPRTGTVSVVIDNRSITLIPASAHSSRIWCGEDSRHVS